MNTISIVAIGDFNGDGNDDILWEVNGLLEMWLMDGSTMTSRTSISAPVTAVNGVPTAFGVAAVGDFDGDGRFDIVWRGGAFYYVAPMNGATPKPGTIPVLNMAVNWKIQVVADYDGDGKADLLWRNNLFATNEIHFLVGSGQPAVILAVPTFAFGRDFIDP